MHVGLQSSYAVPPLGRRIALAARFGLLALIGAGCWGQGAGVSGTAGTAQFDALTALAVDGAGNVYAADGQRNTVRKITPLGEVSTFAGVPKEYGHVDGAGRKVRLSFSYGMVVDGNGNIYFTDTSGHTIRKITPNGVVSTLAGKTDEPGYVDGPAADARFNYPSSMAMDRAGNLYVVSHGNGSVLVRKITPLGEVSSLGSSAGLSHNNETSHGIAVDGAGNVYLGDDKVIKKLAPSSEVSTLVDMGAIVIDLKMDGAGNLYVACNDRTIKKITPSGETSTFAGRAWESGFADGKGPDARFHIISSLAISSTGDIYVGEWGDVRKITPSGDVSTVAGGTGPLGFTDGILQDNTQIAIQGHLPGDAYYTLTTRVPYWSVIAVAPSVQSDFDLYLRHERQPTGMQLGDVITGSGQYAGHIDFIAIDSNWGRFPYGSSYVANASWYSRDSNPQVPFQYKTVFKQECITLRPGATSSVELNDTTGCIAVRDVWIAAGQTATIVITPESVEGCNTVMAYLMASDPANPSTWACRAWDAAACGRFEYINSMCSTRVTYTAPRSAYYGLILTDPTTAVHFSDGHSVKMQVEVSLTPSGPPERP